MLSDKSPHLYIIAGPNGSGKTTFVLRFLPYYEEFRDMRKQAHRGKGDVCEI